MPEMKQSLKPFKALFFETFTIFKTDWMRFAKMILINILGIMPFIVVIGLFTLNTAIFKNTAIIQFVLNIILVVAALAALIFAVYIGVTAKIGIYNLLKDRTGKIFDIFRYSRKRFWSFIWLAILTALLIFLWTLALIIPGIIFGVYYSLALYVFIFEGKTGYSAIKRSRKLIKGYWWAFLGRVILFSIIIMVAYVIAVMVLDVPTLAFAKESRGRMIMENISAMIGSLLSSFIVAPLYMIFTSLIYKDLAAIKEKESSSSPVAQA